MLNQLLSISAIATFGYFIGRIFLDIRAVADGDICVPRTRNERYKIRAFSFFDYLFPILLAVLLLFVGGDNKQYLKVALMSLAVTYILRLFSMWAGRRLNEWLAEYRFTHYPQNIIVLSWLFVSAFLISISEGQNQIIVAYLTSLYIFLSSVQIIAMVSDRSMKIGVSIKMKNGKVLTNKVLVDESNDYMIIYSGDRCNRQVVLNTFR